MERGDNPAAKLAKLARGSRVVAGLLGQLLPLRSPIAGVALHTENSHKFTLEGLRRLARQAGFRPGRAWVDEQGLFSVHWLHAP